MRAIILALLCTLYSLTSQAQSLREAWRGNVGSSELVIEKNDDTGEIEIKVSETAIYSTSDYFAAGVTFIFEMESAWAVLVGFSTGGTACPELYRFIHIPKNKGQAHITEEFGNCVDLPQFARQGDRIQIAFEGLDKPFDIYEYDGKQVAEIEASRAIGAFAPVPPASSADEKAARVESPPVSQIAQGPRQAPARRESIRFELVTKKNRMTDRVEVSAVSRQMLGLSRGGQVEVSLLCPEPNRRLRIQMVMFDNRGDASASTSVRWAPLRNLEITFLQMRLDANPATTLYFAQENYVNLVALDLYKTDHQGKIVGYTGSADEAAFLARLFSISTGEKVLGPAITTIQEFNQASQLLLALRYSNGSDDLIDIDPRHSEVKEVVKSCFGSQ